MPMSPRLLRPRAAASAGFDPRTIGTMLAWYDFSDSSTLTMVSGLVSEIRNKSGTAPTLSQGTEANRPSLSTIGGRQAALFDGSNDYLFSNTAVLGSGTLAVVLGPISGTDARVAACFASQTGILESFNCGHAQSLSFPRPSFGGRFTGTSGVNSAVMSAITGADSYVSIGTFNRTSSPVPRVNGVTTTIAGGSGPGNVSQATIGSQNVNATYVAFWASAVGEVLLYPFVLTADQIAAVENYLKAKWSVTF